MTEERLQKFLASAGVASRRKAEELIEEGRVFVNGSVVRGPGLKIDPEIDLVEVDGTPVRPPAGRVYFLLNKPTGYITTASDEQGRPTVLDLVDGVDQRVFPVGRLDLETEGLLVLTSDGDFAHLLMHPRHRIWKTYLVAARGKITEEELDKVRSGLVLEDGPTAPARADLVESGERSIVRVSIREGRKRQVRRMFSALGHAVERLERISYGPLELGDLPRGRWRHLTGEEVSSLTAAAET